LGNFELDLFFLRLNLLLTELGVELIACGLVPVLYRPLFVVLTGGLEGTSLLVKVLVFVSDSSQKLVPINLVTSGILVLKVIYETFQIFVLNPSVQIFHRKPTEHSYFLNITFLFLVPNVLVSFEVSFLVLILLSVLLPLILVLVAASPVLGHIMCLLFYLL
jgi:hypothetical protein